MANLRDELRRIYTKMGGEITPQAVVDDSRPPDAPLHNRFEWDNTVAGEKYRIVQAQELIRSAFTVYARDKRGPKTVREFVSTYQAGSPETGVYKRTEEMLQDPVSEAILLRECQRAIEDLKRRYGHLKEFGKLIRDAAGQADSA
jgi:hypothetical protein